MIFRQAKTGKIQVKRKTGLASRKTQDKDTDESHLFFKKIYVDIDI